MTTEPITASPTDSDAERPSRGRVRVVPPGPDDTRPIIRLSVDLHNVVDRGVEALASDPDLYQRDGHLVNVLRATPEDARGARARVSVGTPQIRMMASPTLRERLTRAARWQRFDSRAEKWIAAIPSDNVVGAVLARGSWRGIPDLAGILEAPALRPDGTIIDRRGYDEATGYLYLPGQDFGRVADHPTQDQARAALAALCEPFAEMPHKSEAHRMAAVAAILTLLARPAICGSVPAFILDASTRGSGKSLAADVISVVATGRPTAKMSYPADEIELEKVLGAYAIRGATLINFDNVTARFGGGPLDRCITAGDAVELRVLGRSEVPMLRWNAVILATGNNVTLAGDTARRVLVSRLESMLENPEDRSDFTHPDLIGWVITVRPRLVRAAMTILRAFVCAGWPIAACKTWGSFTSWSALIPPAIVYAGGADPMATRPASEGGEEPEKAALAVLLRDLPRLDPDGVGLTAKAMVGLLYTPERLRGQSAPDGFEELREALETLVTTKPGLAPDPTKIGYSLRRFRGRVVAGKRLEATPSRAGVARWKAHEPR